VAFGDFTLDSQKLSKMSIAMAFGVFPKLLEVVYFFVFHDL